MKRQSEEKKKLEMNIRRILPYFAAAFISYWLSELYMNRLSARIFTSAALTEPDIVGAAAPFSYRIVARIIVSVALFVVPLLFVSGFKEKPWKGLWIIAIVLAIPQVHGETCLYEDGLLVTTTPFGSICCEHTLNEVSHAEIEVGGRPTVHGRSGPRLSSNLTMTLHIPCRESDDVFVFSIESFSGKEENDRLNQMVHIRKQLPSAVVSVEPYTQRELRQTLADEGLMNVNPALIKELLKEPQ